MSSYRMKYKIGLMEHSLVVPEDISSIPLGTILPYSANTLNPPAGFLFCDGSAVSRTMYPDLFALIGTLYGSGDGSTTFNLPNLIGNKFLEGYSSAGTSKDAGIPNLKGTAFLASTTDGYAVGKWSVTAPFETDNDPNISSSNFWVSRVTNGSNTTAARYLGFDASLSSSVYRDSITTVQPSSLTVRYIIKAFNTISNESQLIDVTQYSSDLAMRLQRQQVPAYNQRVEITTSQTWSAPISGWYKFTIKGAGGGGQGGGYSSSFHYGGNGGGEGGTTLVTKKLEQGTSVVIVVGAGGTGGSKGTSGYGSAGGTGGNTTVTIGTTVYTGGGGYGGYNGTVGGGGTIPGATGTPGCVGSTSATIYGGAGGGQGGSVSSHTALFGGGGYGGHVTAGNVAVDGGNGSPGFVWIEYFDPSL